MVQFTFQVHCWSQSQHPEFLQEQLCNDEASLQGQSSPQRHAAPRKRNAGPSLLLQQQAAPKTGWGSLKDEFE